MPKLSKGKGWRQKSAGSNKVELEISLDELFDSDVPKTSEFRQSVGQAILDVINSRTAANKSYTGSKFKNYSKEYAKSLEFKAHGKSKNNPNLKLTGDMMGLLDITKQKDEKIILGWRDSGDAAKAYNHVTGDTLPRRDFLGLNNKEIKGLKKDFKDELETAEEAPKEDESSTAAELSIDAFLAGSTAVKPSDSLESILDRILGIDGES